MFTIATICSAGTGGLRQNAWLLYDAGKAAKSPDEVGIERP